VGIEPQVAQICQESTEFATNDNHPITSARVVLRPVGIWEVEMEDVGEQELLVEQIAALDLGKATLQACVRVPHMSRPARRMQEVRAFGTTTSALLGMADWFGGCGVTRVVMESTSDPVDVYVRPENSSKFALLAALKTTSTGTVAVTHKPTVSSVYVLTFPGNADLMCTRTR
jgi:hypothetical protein